MGFKSVLFFVLFVSFVVRFAMAKEFSDSGVTRSASAILASYYQDAAARLKKIVLSPPGKTEGSRAYRAAWAAQQIQQIDQLNRSIKKSVSGWIGKNLPAAYGEGLALADRQAKEAGLKVDRGGVVPIKGTIGSFAKIDDRTVAVFARDTFADLSKAAESMTDRASKLLRTTAQENLSEEQINTILAGGVIEGRPLDTIRNLREQLRAVAGDKVTIVDKNGDPMEFDVGYYAEMVARTRTRQATVIARHERLAELDIDLVAIVGRVSNNFCSAFLGQVFSLSGKSTKYPAYDSLPGGGPPFHPHCSKSTRPFIEELASDAQVEAAQGVEDSQKLLGMDTTKAQRAYKDLQIRQQVENDYVKSTKA